MITYEPKERRKVARELARIINDSDTFLLDDVVASLNKEGRDNLLQALQNGEHFYTQECLDSIVEDAKGQVATDMEQQLKEDLDSMPHAELLEHIK